MMSDFNFRVAEHRESHEQEEMRYWVGSTVRYSSQPAVRYVLQADPQYIQVDEVYVMSLPLLRMHTIYMTSTAHDLF